MTWSGSSLPWATSSCLMSPIGRITCPVSRFQRRATVCTRASRCSRFGGGAGSRSRPASGRSARRVVGLIEDQRQADEVAVDELDLDDLLGADKDDIHVG